MRNFPLYVTMQAFDGLAVRLPRVMRLRYRNAWGRSKNEKLSSLCYDASF